MDQNAFRQMIQQRRIPTRPKPVSEDPPLAAPADEHDEKSLKERSFDWVKQYDKDHKQAKHRERLRERQMEKTREEREKKRAKTDSIRTEEEKLTSKYRDRAGERRMAETDESTANRLIQSLTAEETKYMSGDTEFTGAVVGLDRVLLAKEREKARKLEEEEKKKREQVVKEPERHKIVMDEQKHNATSSIFAKNILRHTIDDETVPHHIDMFIPGHFMYKFHTVDLPSMENDDVPVSQFRSVADCPKVEDKSNCIISDEIFRVLERSAVRFTSGKSKKGKKKQRIEAPIDDVEVPHATIDSGVILIPFVVPEPKIELVEPEIKDEKVAEGEEEVVEEEVVEDIFADVGRDYRIDYEEIVAKKKKSDV